MMMKRIVSLSLVVVVTLAFIGCGPKAQLKPDFEKLNVASLAVLPIIDKSELPQDQVAAAFQGLAQELRNAGFLVLDDSITQSVCPSMPCPEQRRLFDDYLVDATVQLTIDSTTQTNVLAGYYNDLSGSLTLNNKNGEELAKITGTEREKGGLLFNTSQILQGLISQSRNEGVGKLLNPFFRKLVAQVPSPSAQAQRNTDATTIAIKSINTRVTGADEREICVSATPRSLAFVLLGRIKSNLPEISPGKYCRQYFLNASFGTGSAEIEVRSPVGNSIRSPLTLADAPDCNISQSVTLAAAATRFPAINFSCPTESGKGPLKFVIFKSDNQLPKYLKIGESNGREWVDRSATAGTSEQYVVIAKTAHGDRSLPIFLTAMPSPQASTEKKDK